jgi:hypothetical protein
MLSGTIPSGPARDRRPISYISQISLFSVFTLPKNGPVYTGTILERCHRLIRSGIWSGIKPEDLQAWMTNFQDEKEKYFAACILDSLIFRSEEQTVSMMRDIFDVELPSLGLISPSATAWGLDLKDYLRNKPSDKTRPLMIVPVIRRDEPPTKSGPMIARMLKRRLQVDQYHIAWPWQIAEWRKKYNTQFVLFVDDLLGTGTQIKKFINSFELEPVVNEMSCIYCPLAAHEKGISRVRKWFPALSLVCSEHLGSQHDVFNPEHGPFNDSTNSSHGAFEFYSAIMNRVRPQRHRRGSGFGNLGLTYAFHHGTPNNTLPILWWSIPGVWTPLLKR